MTVLFKADAAILDGILTVTCGARAEYQLTKKLSINYPIRNKYGVWKNLPRIFHKYNYYGEKLHDVEPKIS